MSLEAHADPYTILNAAVDPIVTIDASGTILWANDATEAKFGWSRSEIAGEPVSMLMPHDDAAAHQGYIDHYLESGEARIIGRGRELTALHRDGHSIPIHLAVSEIADTTPRSFMGIMRDLSELRAAQDALLKQQANVAHAARLSVMGEMTASIAHEINQPLTAISLYAQSGIRLLEQTPIPADKLTALSGQAGKPVATRRCGD